MPRELPDVGSDSNLGDRMRAAIKDLGFKDVKAFAAAKNLAYESLLSVMAQRRGMTEDRLKMYADMLDVPVNWLRNGPNGKVHLETSIEVRKVISWNFSPMGSVDGGNALRRGVNPHFVKRVESPFVVPGVERANTFVAYCDGTTDVGLIEGTMILCSEYVPPKAVAKAVLPLLRETLETLTPNIGYLIREEKHDTERFLPFFRQYADVHASPAMPSKALRLPTSLPNHYEIIGMVHAFWRDIFRNGTPG